MVRLKYVPEKEEVQEEEVQEEESSSGGLAKLVKEVRVVGVDRFIHYRGCLKCSAKVKVDVDEKEVGECHKM